MNFKGLNTPLLNLDPYLDIEFLIKNKRSIDLAIAKSINQMYFAFHTEEDTYDDKSHRDWMHLYRDNKNDFPEIDGLSYNQKAVFLLLNQDCVSLCQFIIIKKAGEINQDFSLLLDWINRQDLYESIKTCYIFLNTEGKETLKHTDSAPEASKRELVWITLDERKRFYVEVDGKKIYSEGKSMTFLPSNLHGTESCLKMSYSIRLEGKFSEKFKIKTGLQYHFKP